jgi:hypothetical protein
MKNIQVIDGADNCAFPIYQVTEEEFRAIFPEEGQDIEFAEDLFGRLGEKKSANFVAKIWKRAIAKSEAMGIHGTLFYEFSEKRKYFPESKKEYDWDPQSISEAHEKMHADHKMK